MDKTFSSIVNSKLCYISNYFYLPSHSENVRREASLSPAGNTECSIPILTGERAVPSLLNLVGLNQYFSKFYLRVGAAENEEGTPFRDWCYLLLHV